MALAPAPFIFAAALTGSGIPPFWRLATAAIAAISCLVSAFFILRRPGLARLFGGLAVLTGAAALFPYLAADPLAALLGAVAIISAGYALVDFRRPKEQGGRPLDVHRTLLQARWSAIIAPLLVVVALFVDAGGHLLSDVALTVSALVSQILVAHWQWRRAGEGHSLAWLIVPGLAAGAVGLAFFLGHAPLVIFGLGLVTSLLLPRSAPAPERHGPWWEVLINDPARILFSTFLALSLLGTLLLLLPGTTPLKTLSLVDAAFTAVSAVCVTGLIVVDTPQAFTLFGQILILLLIQLGGLGIMTITTVALHAMGQRLSLRQERMLMTMTESSHHDLLVSLVTIIKFTFVAEAVGALVLAGSFFSLGDPLWQAVWRGLFTAVSAFCNAGFALQSNSLVEYQGQPLVLHVVAILIVFGGMAPATSLMVPRWLAGKAVPLVARLALITTAVLLVSGTFFFLVLEWSNALSGLSVADKIHNAWFQSVTLRTAGFNSVDISGVIGPTFLIMLCFMFIGGSPGGTAGGAKTTTMGVLAMTFWASIVGRDEVVAYNRRIPPATINRAITIMGSGILIWFVMVIMLETTQQISSRDLIFEVTSALGTVGLSTGATDALDGIGKVIVMLAMFIGRIGPMTLFMLLSEHRPGTVSRYLDARITLT
ncbi:MAG: potassium transporter TrkG [Desulfurivibrionaceae bacterium]|nr:potassium transporter TrkG [Desulfurivibrionaceae bacterium]